MMDDTNDDTVTVQEAFERGHDVEMDDDTDLDESLMDVVEDYDTSSDDENHVVDERGSSQNDESHPDTLTIRVPLDDRHGPMVSDIQDAGVSVEQQFAQDREFMMGVEQRIHGLFQQLKYSDRQQ